MQLRSFSVSCSFSRKFRNFWQLHVGNAINTILCSLACFQISSHLMGRPQAWKQARYCDLHHDVKASVH